MLKEVNIRFYAELNDLLPADRRDTGFNYDIIKPRSVKDLIESQLLPLTKQHYDRFYQCDTCQKIYWKGSQFENTQMLIKQLNGVSNDKL